MPQPILLPDDSAKKANPVVSIEKRVPRGGWAPIDKMPRSRNLVVDS